MANPTDWTDQTLNATAFTNSGNAPATMWTGDDGDPSAGIILLESGYNILLENGSNLLLE